MSFKAEFSDDGGRSFATNALRFATREEADAYARDLFMRWLGATDHRTAESTEPVNYAWTEDGLKRLEEES